ISVTAQDQFGVTTTGYAGTVHFSSSDAKAWLPADVTLNNGLGFFATILKTASNQSLTAVDKVNSALSGTTGAIVVSPAAVNHFGFTVPTIAATGVPFSFTVTALDPYNNVLTGYNGAVHFVSNDGAATVPADATLTSGTGAFNATLRTVGSQLLIGTDTVTTSITGASSLIATRGLMVSALTPTPLGFVASFNKPFDPSAVNLYDGVGTYGASDVTLTGPSGLVRGSLLLDPSSSSFTFIKTGVGTTGLFAGVLAAGNYTVTFRSAANAFKDADGGLLDGNGDGVSGDNFATTFTVGAASVPVLSIPDFARGPNGAANIKVPQLSSGGIPITLTNAAGVTDVTFKLNYNPALLNISSTLSNTSGTFTLIGTPTNGVANFSFHSNTALNGNVTLGQIVAQVPDSAATSYKAKELLHLSNIILNGSTTTAINDDGVHVSAYPGDVSGDGSLSPLDAALTSRVATIFDSGFAAYRLADPAIVGDLNGNSFTDSSDVTLINRTLAGITVGQLPPIPTGLTIVPTGPDPTLSLPTDLTAAPGETVVVPVHLDTARPEGSTGLMEAILALRYDPKVFTVSAQDVHLGTLPTSASGWKLQAVVNAQTGEIGIDLFSPTPIVSASGGSLVTLTLHVLDNAPSGASGINLVRAVNPTGQRQFVTTASDAAGPYILHPAVTDSSDAGVDGRVTVPAMLMETASTPQSMLVTAAALGTMLDVVLVPATVASVGHAKALDLAEQIFANLQESELTTDFGDFGHPDAIVETDSTDQPSAASAWVAPAVGLFAFEPDWMSTDCLACLGQYARRGAKPAKGILEFDAQEADADPAVLDEMIFTRNQTGRS
ncbi:MAG TPA: cohesin domain-containing protein, partial [Gemmataceae bacterium]|nr:cohesin domain-containing protein [Gemmataceae bacterium]